jgi:hypothetical protein
MSASTSIARFDLARLRPLADWLAIAIAVAVTLPWSTTAVGIAIAAWAVTVLLSLDAAAVKREICSPAGGLPVVLWCLGIVGMLWADVNWHDRFAGLSSFHRLLAIPLLLAQFRRSANGIWVVCAFFISSLGLLLASYFIVFALGDRWRGVGGVPVHDAIYQGSIFLICSFGAFGYVVLARGKWGRSIALSVIGIFFLINFAVATASRAALVIAPLLLALLGWRLFRRPHRRDDTMVDVDLASWFVSRSGCCRLAWLGRGGREYPVFHSSFAPFRLQQRVALRFRRQYFRRNDAE